MDLRLTTLDVTGLSCYRLDRIPAWYDAFSETDRWNVQARWWKKIAETSAGHPAVFCFDLMNEPIVGGRSKEGEPRWVGGELAGFYFVQKNSEDAKGTQIAEAWVAQLTGDSRGGHQNAHYRGRYPLGTNLAECQAGILRSRRGY